MDTKIIDLHGDLLSHFTVERLNNKTDIFKKAHYSKFKQGNVFLSVFNMWVYDDLKETPKNIIVQGSKELLQNNDILNIVRKYSDITNDGRINYIIGLEGIDYLSNCDEIYPLYQYGVRLISLTWNYSNMFAASITDDNDYGLTAEGEQAIKIMNELNIIIDISHVSDKAASSITELSSSPIIASHSNVRSLCNCDRNLNDDLIKKIAKTNGVIGMNSYPGFISNNDKDKTLKGLIMHIDYIKNLVGINHVALGFDFMDYLDESASSLFDEPNTYIDNFINHNDLPNLVQALIDHGFTNEEIDKITHENALRVIKEVIE